MPVVQETIKAITAALPEHFPGCSIRSFQAPDDKRRQAWTFEVSEGEKVRYLFTFTHEFLRDTEPHRLSERLQSLRGETLGYKQAEIVVKFGITEFVREPR